MKRLYSHPEEQLVIVSVLIQRICDLSLITRCMTMQKKREDFDNGQQMLSLKANHASAAK